MAAVQLATSFPSFTFPVRQTPTNLSVCGLRKNQLGADGQHWRLDLFSHLKLKEKPNSIKRTHRKKRLYHHEYE
jgi:hypothetical protein